MFKDGMQRRAKWTGFWWGLVWIFFLCIADLALARSDFAVSIARDGTLVGGSGDGDGWHYYSGSDAYVMWFSNGTYDPAVSVRFDTYLQIRILDATKQMSVDVSFGWTTPAWTSTGKSTPPLPSDTGGSINSTFIQQESLYADGWIILGEGSTIEPHQLVSVPYNPQWVCIIVKGKNLNLLGFFDEYTGTSGGNEGGEDEGGVQLGACCNQQTGECYIAGTCVNPYIWLGAGTTCSDCKIETRLWDFGDAPAPYPTLLSKNGARHTVKAGIYLGQNLSRDADGKPSSGADGDDYDDGVVFTSALVPGQSATIQVSASVNGVLSAWLDLNRDGDWADPGEQVIIDQPITRGNSTISFNIPTTTTKGVTFARFRFSTVGGLSYDGLAQDGEVEDYRIEITSGSSGGGGGTTPTPGTYGPQPPTYGYYPKWSQPARQVGQALQGWAESSLYQTGPILADDWQDKDGRPVVGIRWWGCFANWIQTSPPTVVPTAFHIAIWTDAMGSGFPASMVWEATCTDWAWAFAGYAQDPRGLGIGNSVFEMTFILSQDKWFYPSTITGSRYWVSISAIYAGQTNIQYPWGILTRQKAFGGAAMRIQTIGSGTAGQAGQWPPTIGSLFINGLPVTYPVQTPWDLSFELISTRSGWGGGSGISGSGDVNGDGKVDTTDMAALINILLGAELFK